MTDRRNRNRRHGADPPSVHRVRRRHRSHCRTRRVWRGRRGRQRGPAAGTTGRSVASFFSFYDFARKIARETPVTLKNLVPTGLHGHGWEPDASVTRDIIDADAFVHVGEDFQPWADRAIQTIEDDDADTS